MRVFFSVCVVFATGCDGAQPFDEAHVNVDVVERDDARDVRVSLVQQNSTSCPLGIDGALTLGGSPLPTVERGGIDGSGLLAQCQTFVAAGTLDDDDLSALAYDDVDVVRRATFPALAVSHDIAFVGEAVAGQEGRVRVERGDLEVVLVLVSLDGVGVQVDEDADGNFAFDLGDAGAVSVDVEVRAEAEASDCGFTDCFLDIDVLRSLVVEVR